ncbi:MAG: antibiotic biosynthesis monooxygenase [Bacteroidetes bacterium]|nr:antibiotic biosynthesis monooxygenase [Bacteroidota bacterium]
MEKLALLVTLQAKSGKEKDVEAFLKGGLELAQQEPKTNHWFAFKTTDGKYGIFDTFDDESGRDAHLTGKIAEAPKAKSDELFSAAPKIEKVELIAMKEVEHHNV